jgi:iron complex outermembrane receptor protein
VTLKNIFGKSTTLSHEQADLSGTPFGVISLHDDGGNKFDQETLSDELQLQGPTFSNLLKYIGGVYWSQNSETIDSPVTVGATIPPPFGPIAAFHYANKTTDHSTAVFAQGTYDLSQLTGVSGLSFTGGYRYTWERLTITQLEDSEYAAYPAQATDESNPSWQIGLQEQLNPDLLLYVVTRGSWRAGGFNGVTAPVDNADAFGPERTHDVEIGSKFAGRLFDRATHFNLALYDQIVDQAERDIYYVVGGNVGSLTTNIPQARILGVEADGDVRALPFLTLGFQLAYTDAEWKKPLVTLPGGEVTAASSYGNTPRWSGTVFAKVDLPTPEAWGPMYLRADGYSQASEYFSNFAASLAPDTRIPGYTLLNMRYGWDIRDTHASVAIFGKNLTGKEYFLGGVAYGTSDGVNVVTPGPPRTFGAEFTYKF